MLRNARIEEDIRSALDLDARIRDPRTIAVFADGIGTVSLRGTVGSLRQKRAAGDDARGVDGVFEVINGLRVDLRGPGRRSDDELRARALEAIMADVRIPPGQVDVHVSQQWVTLTGRVDSQRQSDAAFDDVSSLVGVRGLTSAIKVSVR